MAGGSVQRLFSNGRSLGILLSLFVAGQATLLEPCVLLTLFHMATVPGMIAVLGVERFEEARGDAVVATGRGVALRAARAAGDVLGVDVGRQRVVAGLATDTPRCDEWLNTTSIFCFPPVASMVMGLRMAPPTLP